jgi:hypothetical protein
MPKLVSQICVAAGACAVIAAAPIGSVAIFQSASPTVGPLSTAGGNVAATTSSTVEATTMAVPAIKGPAPLPKEEQGLP